MLCVVADVAAASAAAVAAVAASATVCCGSSQTFRLNIDDINNIFLNEQIVACVRQGKRGY